MQNENDRIRVLLVEGNVLVRLGLRVLLESTGSIHVVDEAETASMAMILLMKHNPDVVLLGVKLPDGSGMDICHEIRAAFPQTRVLLLGALADIDTMRCSTNGVAAGYLHNTIAPGLLVSVIKTVARTTAPTTTLRRTLS